MKKFEDSLIQTTPPTPEVGAFRQALRHDLTLAHQQQSLRRWRRACLLSGAAAVILAAAVGLLVLDPQVAGNLHATLGGSAPASTATTNSGTPALDTRTLLARREIDASSDREFLEAFYASGGQEPVEVRSLTSERLLAVREFTLSDGKQMTVYTELGDSEPSDPFTVARPATLTF